MEKRMYRRIRDLREDHDFNQEKIAELLGCKQSTYSDYETGRCDISTQRLITLSEIYGVSTDYILGVTDNPQKSVATEKASLQQRMKELRKKHRMTQAEIASKINCSQRIYSDYESGRYDISTETLISIAKIYRVSTDYVLGISDN